MRFLLCLLALLLVAPPAAAQGSSLGKESLGRVTIDQRLDNQLDGSLVFRDAGQEVELGSYFGSRPIVLALVYNRCPMLCTSVLQGLVSALKTLDMSAGQDFEVLVVSFDPAEDPAIAADARATLLRRYGRSGAEQGIHFLTGSAASITALTDAVGFRYEYDKKTDQYAHPSAITVLTPGGKVARYLFGSEYSPRDLRLGLREASEGKVGSVTDELLLLCYRYDPMTGTYSATVVNAVRAGGVATLAILGVFMFRSRRQKKQEAR